MTPRPARQGAASRPVDRGAGAAPRPPQLRGVEFEFADHGTQAPVMGEMWTGRRLVVGFRASLGLELLRAANDWG